MLKEGTQSYTCKANPPRQLSLAGTSLYYYNAFLFAGKASLRPPQC